MGIKTFEPYRRDGSRTVDAGADFARQLDRFGRDVKKRLAVLETPAPVAGIPPFGKVFTNVAVAGDNLVHTIAHGLGRTYVGGLVIGYGGSGWHVIVLSPTGAVTLGEDPEVDVAFVNQYTTPGGITPPVVNAATFDLWVW